MQAREARMMNPSLGELRQGPPAGQKASTSVAAWRALLRPPVLLALAYAGMGGTWIAFSDRLLLSLSLDTATYATASQGKGFAFVLATSLLVYMLASRGPLRMPGAPGNEAPQSERHLTWIAAAMAVLILAAGMLAVRQAARHARQQSAEQLQGLASIRADVLASWIARRKADGEALLGDPQLQAGYRQWRRGAGQLSPQRWREDIDARLLATRFSDAWLLDADGTVLLSRGAQDPGIDPAHLRWELRAALLGHQVRIANVRGPDDQDVAALGMDVLLPLSVQPGVPEGVLMLRAEPPLPSQAASTSPIQLLVRLRDEATPADSAGDGGQRGNSRDEADKAMLSAMAPIVGSNWQVLAQMPRSLVDAGVWKESIWLGLADLFALLMSSSLVYGLRQRQALATARRDQAALADQVRGWQVLEAIANSSTDAIYAKDREGHYLFANKEACRLLGRTLEELLDGDLQAVCSHEQAQQMAAVDRVIMLSGRPSLSEARLTTIDGDRTYLCTKGPLLDADGRLIGAFGLSRDITEHKQNEERHRQWATAFENMRDGVMITDACCRIQAVNRAFTEITGYAAGDVIGGSPRILASDRQSPAFYSQMWSMLRETGSWHGEIWNRRKNGEIYPEWMTISAVRDEQGRPTHYVGVFTDVSRIKSDEEKLERLAHYDPLTGLPNRSLVLDQLAVALLRARRASRRTAALVIDLDGFKTVNDSLGHPAGDELLVCIAGRLKNRLRQEDLLGRLGGDEFLVMLESLADPADAAALAQDLLGVISAPVPLACGQDAYVTASIGISINPDDGNVGAVELLRDADAAMYRAKELGRNRYCYYTSEMNAQAMSKLELEAALSRALERKELLLHYQPKVELRSGTVIGAEALLRWERRGIGLVPPGKFIPVAEQSSLILEIGAWVIDEACRQLRAWFDEGRPLVRIAVNVAARQFMAGDLDHVVAGALARHAVSAQWLEIELTEGMLVTDPQAAIEMMNRLHRLGVKLSLDDFGTGFSSLAYLQKFPIDALKIDQTFVRDIGREPDGAVLVDSVIALAHRFHLRVVAEGVETAAQRDYLLQQGCDEVQGYFFGRPDSAPALQAMLELAEAA